MKRMLEAHRKSPMHLTLKVKRMALSTRVKAETRQILKQAAKEAKTSLSDLSAAVLDDYADWLKGQSFIKRRANGDHSQ